MQNCWKNAENKRLLDTKSNTKKNIKNKTWINKRSLRQMSLDRRSMCRQCDDQLHCLLVFHRYIQIWTFRVEFYRCLALRSPLQSQHTRRFEEQPLILFARLDFCTAICCSHKHHYIQRSLQDHDIWSHLSNGHLGYTNFEWKSRCTDSFAWCNWRKRFEN